jgi:hypothetical protein
MDYMEVVKGKILANVRRCMTEGMGPLVESAAEAPRAADILRRTDQFFESPIMDVIRHRIAAPVEE